MGNLNVNVGLYFINPYTSQASLNDPFNTFNIFEKYALENLYLLHSSTIKEFNFTLVNEDNLYIPKFGFKYLFTIVVYACIVLYLKLVLQ